MQGIFTMSLKNGLKNNKSNPGLYSVPYSLPYEWGCSFLPACGEA